MEQGKLSYCGEIVRGQDPDRFLLSHFAPPDRREALWALFAFNHEIAKTREVVSETQLGLIRLQWWRDAIAAIYDRDVSEGGAIPAHGGGSASGYDAGKILENPIVQALAQAIEAYGLNTQEAREDFDALIYAREFDLEDLLPSDVEGLAHYADFTSTPLMRLSLRITGGDVDVEPVAAVATNYALAGILRASVSFARQRRCYLPQALLDRHGVGVNKLYDPPLRSRQDEIDAVRRGMCGVIEEAAEMFVDGVKCDDRLLRAHQRLAAVYMGQLKRLGYDVFDGRLVFPPAFKALRVYLDL